MKKLIATTLITSLLVTPFISNQAYANNKVEPINESAKPFQLPYLTSPTVAKAMKNSTYRMKAPNGKSVGLADSFDYAERVWSNPLTSTLTTDYPYNVKLTSTYGVDKGHTLDLSGKNYTLLFDRDISRILVDKMTFRYDGKYSPSIIEKSFGKHVSTKQLKDGRIYREYNNSIKYPALHAFYKKYKGTWRLETFEYTTPNIPAEE
ncbi:hypothetical protein [Macrococcus brunensis]|uniref:hypothetical protein n=1 Tax=Macrococcus brunensis TaxID=198483 RepID=UPI001EF013BA|nr:hypothetical protein [Macrococcus brunensis]ULG74460.1 hypothetical protein MGG13_01410 [Macrococcus brunensis]